MTVSRGMVREAREFAAAPNDTIAPPPELPVTQESSITCQYRVGELRDTAGVAIATYALSPEDDWDNLENYRTQPNDWTR